MYMLTALKKLFTYHNFVTLFTIVVFLVPLVVSGSSAYPFLFHKALLVEGVALVLTVGYALALLFKTRTYFPRPSWLGLAMLVFYICIFASAIMGVDFYRSLWSRAERMTGLVLMLHYGALFVVWRSILTPERWRKLWQVFVLVGVAPLVVAIWQLFNPAFLFNLGAARVASTLGNPIYTAGFALFVFFSCLFFSYSALHKRGKLAWAAAALVALVALFATETRGAIIALWVGVVAGVVIVISDKRYAIGGTLGLVKKKYFKIALGVLVVLPLLFGLLRGTSLIKNIPGIGTLFSTPLEQSTGGTRLIFWQVAYDGWKEKPLLGWGWENFFDLANKHYNPTLLRYGVGEEWVDNAHNIIVNTLATTGALGLAAWVGIYVAAVLALRKKYIVGGAPERALAVTLAILLLVDLVRTFFIFEDITSYLVWFWILAGIDIWCNTTTAAEPAAPFVWPRFLTRGFLRIPAIIGRIMLAVALVATGWALLRNVVYMPGRADYYQAMAIKAAMVDFGKAIRLHSQAIKVKPNPYTPDLSFDLGQFFVVWLGNHQDFAFSDYRKLAYDMYTLGTDALKSYLSRYPHDVRAGSVLARAYQDGYDLWQSPAYLTQAEDEYNAMLPLSPRRQTLLLGLGRTKLLAGKPDEALPLFMQARDEDTSVSTPHWYLALVYIQKKDFEKAEPEVKQAVSLGYTFSSTDLLVAYDMFKEHGALGDLAPAFRTYIFNSSKPNGQVVEKYAQYLREVGDAAQLEVLTKYVGGK